MLTFKEMQLTGALIKNLQELGYEQPTPVQEQAIPIILSGQDVLGIAQTGTGKTAAFCLPILQKLLGSTTSSIKTLILVPTRELATQVHVSLEKYGLDMGLKSLAVYGGVGQATQVRSLRTGVDILVATPGRLLDLINQGHIHLNKVEILVLDEADRMLDMGFIEDIETILENLPKSRQSLFFSATMPAEIISLSRKILISPTKVELTADHTNALKIEQKVIFCKREDKFQLLKNILKSEPRELVVVFTKTKNSADKVKAYLLFYKIPSTVFHGDKSQEVRERALLDFKKGSMKILIATDIASRGIDVQGVSHVINFELPLDPESYIHRIGRTARAGHEGVAISFCEDSEKQILKRIEKLTSQIIPSESFKGVAESAGKWLQEGSIKSVKAPTPGKSQEKSAYIDHSKRQRLLVDGEKKVKLHPGFKKKKMKKK